MSEKKHETYELRRGSASLKKTYQFQEVEAEKPEDVTSCGERTLPPEPVWIVPKRPSAGPFLIVPTAVR
jgi:hypothetical protein